MVPSHCLRRRCPAHHLAVGELLGRPEAPATRTCSPPTLGEIDVAAGWAQVDGQSLVGLLQAEDLDHGDSAQELAEQAVAAAGTLGQQRRLGCQVAPCG